MIFEGGRFPFSGSEAGRASYFDPEFEPEPDFEPDFDRDFDRDFEDRVGVVPPRVVNFSGFVGRWARFGAQDDDIRRCWDTLRRSR
jgi:hypothetical protein